MIIQLRIDERLIHGQITTAWSRSLNVDGIVVANDDVARNELTVKVLKMSAPAGKKVMIKSVEGSIEALKDPRSDSMRILILVDNPKDALTMAEELNIRKINVGNYVRKQSEDKYVVSSTITADEEDMEFMKQLCELNGAEVFHQILPTTPSVPLRELISKAQDSK